MRSGKPALLAAVLLASVSSCPLPAQAEGTAALSGVWWIRAHIAHLQPMQGGPIPFTADGTALYAANVAKLKQDPALDTAHTLCVPPGLPRVLTAPYPFQIFQSHGQIVFVHEVNRAFRIVPLRDAHADPAIWDPSYMGEGIGRWDGEELVIDTRNFNAKTWLDDTGLPHSEQLHTVEKLRVLAGGEGLEDVVTIEDPGLYTKPWSVRLLFSHRPDTTVVTDWACGEPHRDVAGVRSDLAAAAVGAVGAAASDDSHGLAGYWEETRGPRRGPPGGVPPGGGPPGGGPPGGGPPGDGPPGGPGGPPRGGGPGAKISAAAEGHLQPWVAKRLEEYQAALAAGGLPRTNANQCLPWAIPGLGIPGGPAYNMNIVTTPQQVVFMYELDHQARIVYLNQPQPTQLAPSYFGHSVGHWEGDTLIVDSVGFNDKTEIHDGIPHTAALHVTERLRINNGHLEDQVTFEDPGAFLTPITFLDSFEHAEPFQEYVCAENNNEALPPPK